MIIGLTGIVKDGTLPAGTISQGMPFPQFVEAPRGEDVVIKLSVIGQNRVAYDISAGQIRFGMRQYRGDEVPLFVVAATTTSGPGGLADIVIPSASTLNFSERFAYLYDVQWLDGASKRWQLVPASRWLAKGIVVRPTEMT